MLMCYCCHLHKHQEKDKEKGGRGEGKEKKKQKKGLPLDKSRGPPLMFLNFFFLSQLCATFEL